MKSLVANATFLIVIQFDLMITKQTKYTQTN